MNWRSDRLVEPNPGEHPLEQSQPFSEFKVWPTKNRTLHQKATSYTRVLLMRARRIHTWPQQQDNQKVSPRITRVTEKNPTTKTRIWMEPRIFAWSQWHEAHTYHTKQESQKKFTRNNAHETSVNPAANSFVWFVLFVVQNKPMSSPSDHLVEVNPAAREYPVVMCRKQRTVNQKQNVEQTGDFSKRRNQLLTRINAMGIKQATPKN